MKSFSLAVFLALVLLVTSPAYAYGDPTGGSFFQILMPMLAAVWATWMILANRIRSAVTTLYRKLRGVEAAEQAD